MTGIGNFGIALSSNVCGTGEVLEISAIRVSSITNANSINELNGTSGLMW
jgi:hypothetical protein